MRPILLAMNNPYRADPVYALFPLPAQSAGGRLFRMLKDLRPELIKADYLGRFDRRNLCQGSWGTRKARVAANDLRLTYEDRCFNLNVVVFGEGPREALGLPKLLLHPIERGGVVYRQLPHPSGRCLWYNHPTHRLLAGLLLEELYEQSV